MTELDRTWAESQIEAMAEGSLTPEAERRMLAAMDRDAGLRTRVEQARALRLALRGLKPAPVPRGLWWRLWQIPTAERGHRIGVWMPAGVLATAVIAVLGVNLFLGTRGPSPEEAAMQDFAVAMAYLQKTALMANNEINQAVGSGVADALEVSRGFLDRPQSDEFNGEQDND